MLDTLRSRIRSCPASPFHHYQTHSTSLTATSQCLLASTHDINNCYCYRYDPLSCLPFLSPSDKRFAEVTGDVRIPDLSEPPTCPRGDGCVWRLEYMWYSIGDMSNAFIASNRSAGSLYHLIRGFKTASSFRSNGSKRVG